MNPEIPKSEAGERREIVEQLRNLLENYSDEIPEEDLTGKRTHKVGGNWFQSVQSNILYALAVGHIQDQALQHDVESFMAEFRARRQAGLDTMLQGEQTTSFVKTTHAEIDTANSLLKRTIELLESGS